MYICEMCVCVCVCVYVCACICMCVVYIYYVLYVYVHTHTHTHTHTHPTHMDKTSSWKRCSRRSAAFILSLSFIIIIIIIILYVCVCVPSHTHTHTHTHTHMHIHIHIHIHAVGIAGSWRKRSSSRYGPDQAPRPSTLKTCPRTIKLQRHGPDQAPGPSTPKHPSPLSSQAQTWTRRCGASTRRIARHAFRRYVSLTSRGGREGGGNGRGGEALSLKVHP